MTTLTGMITTAYKQALIDGVDPIIYVQDVLAEQADVALYRYGNAARMITQHLSLETRNKLWQEAKAQREVNNESWVTL